MYNRVQTLSANTNTGDTMHHHTFVHRRPAHVIDLFGNLFNPSPPTPSWSLVTNPDPTAQAKLRINRNEYALATSCTPDPDDNVYRTADHLSRTLGITHLEAVDTEIAELLTPTRPHQAVPGPRTLRRQATAILTTHQPDARPADPEDPELPTPDLSPTSPSTPPTPTTPSSRSPCPPTKPSAPPASSTPSPPPTTPPGPPPSPNCSTAPPAR